jgi:hypothetical protein
LVRRGRTTSTAAPRVDTAQWQTAQPVCDQEGIGVALAMPVVFLVRPVTVLFALFPGFIGFSFSS